MTELTDEQRGLRDAVRALLSKRSDSAAVRKAMDSDEGYDTDLWTTLCQQIGVAALAVPEEFGGVGATALEAHIVLDELGRTLTPSPMLGSHVTTQFLLALGNADASEQLLPRVAAGEIVALAWADERGWRDGSVELRDNRLFGLAHYVLHGDQADVLLVVTPDGVVEVEPTDQHRIARTHTPTMDPTRRLSSVRFDGPGGRQVPGDLAAARHAALDAASVALSAEAVGGAARILELTVEYAKLRVQFGRPIGSFQALKHRMADLHVLVESARSASYAAARGEVHPSVAKAYCAETFQTVAGEAIQLHGGIAITWEHDAHLYFKRAHGIAQLFGQPAEHVEQLATVAGLPAGIDEGDA